MEKKTFMVTMPALCSPNRAKLMSKKLWNWLLAQIQPWHPGTLTQGKITFEKCQRKRAKIQTYTHTFQLIEWISLGAGSLKGLVLARHSEDQKSPVLPVLKSRGLAQALRTEEEDKREFLCLLLDICTSNGLRKEKTQNLFSKFPAVNREKFSR